MYLLKKSNDRLEVDPYALAADCLRLYSNICVVKIRGKNYIILKKTLKDYLSCLF